MIGYHVEKCVKGKWFKVNKEFIQQRELLLSDLSEGTKYSVRSV